MYHRIKQLLTLRRIAADHKRNGLWRFWQGIAYNRIDELHKEKQRRIYYQDIVYAVCNELDKNFDDKTVCGTIEHPSNMVQERVAIVVRNWQHMHPKN